MSLCAVLPIDVALIYDAVNTNLNVFLTSYQWNNTHEKLSSLRSMCILLESSIHDTLRFMMIEI